MDIDQTQISVISKRIQVEGDQEKNCMAKNYVKKLNLKLPNAVDECPLLIFFDFPRFSTT